MRLGSPFAHNTTSEKYAEILNNLEWDEEVNEEHACAKHRPCLICLLQDTEYACVMPFTDKIQTR